MGEHHCDCAFNHNAAAPPLVSPEITAQLKVLAATMPHGAGQRQELDRVERTEFTAH